MDSHFEGLSTPSQKSHAEPPVLRIKEQFRNLFLPKGCFAASNFEAYNYP